MEYNRDIIGIYIMIYHISYIVHVTMNYLICSIVLDCDLCFLSVWVMADISKMVFGLFSGTIDHILWCLFHLNMCRSGPGTCTVFFEAQNIPLHIMLEDPHSQAHRHFGSLTHLGNIQLIMVESWLDSPNGTRDNATVPYGWTATWSKIMVIP